MPFAPPTHGASRRKAARVVADAARPSAARRGYGRRWQKASKTFLAANPLCVDCLAAGRRTRATVVDHDTPHRGDWSLFWDKTNWRSRCKTCHDRKTATQDGAFGRPRKGS